MKKIVISAITAAVLITSFASSAWAGNLASPVGLWKSTDETGKPRSLIRLTETSGYIQGNIEKVLRGPGEDPNPKCPNCLGGDKGKPLHGMIILAGLHKDGSEYKDGHMIDTATGKVYKCKVELIEGGKKLQVRRYTGLTFFGSTQIWTREQ